MSLRPRLPGEVPAQTAEVARLAFPKGCLCMQIREVIGPLFTDKDFVDLFPQRGQPARPPHQLAIVSVLQFVEGLSDRQAAAALRGRIDWKFLLGLELTDPGFDHSVLSEFRDRLVADRAPRRVLDLVLDRLREADLLVRPGGQRTDSTHVLAAVRRLNRLENTAEHLRAALNALAAAAPEWLLETASADWFDRYQRRIEDYRLPRGEGPRTQYMEQAGQDGMRLLTAVFAPGAPSWLRQIPAVEALRRCWIQEYVIAQDRVRMRDPKDMPPSRDRIESPYDGEARYCIKNATEWSGYKVHLTETCDPDYPHLITHVATTEATVTDVEMTETIHVTLDQAGLLAGEHFVDRGYVNAKLLATSVPSHGIELTGPIRHDITWQGKAGDGFAIDGFLIDWDAHTAVCPQGHRSVRWKPHQQRSGYWQSDVFFDRQDCAACPVRSKCTRSATEPRKLSLAPRAEHDAIRARRQLQETKQWRQHYATRAGVEGTIAQGLRRCGLRKSRYTGLDKTCLQHVLTAAALNLIRTDAWLTGTPLASTRTSRFSRLSPA
ncbi:IS1182 family transposase [Streptomyces sp. NBC_01352]|uniref:IS1182 family transposase n=1 Tax=Streptomyces sp. NBC_01352 TaxID=2903834 RepID=UPI002E37938A|nr:IS1182 family transposase [Streptomyces sp. NBC_01352]